MLKDKLVGLAPDTTQPLCRLLDVTTAEPKLVLYITVCAFTDVDPEHNNMMTKDRKTKLIFIKIFLTKLTITNDSHSNFSLRKNEKREENQEICCFIVSRTLMACNYSVEEFVKNKHPWEDCPKTNRTKIVLSVSTLDPVH